MKTKVESNRAENLFKIRQESTPNPPPSLPKPCPRMIAIMRIKFLVSNLKVEWCGTCEESGLTSSGIFVDVREPDWVDGYAPEGTHDLRQYEYPAIERQLALREPLRCAQRVHTWCASRCRCVRRVDCGCDTANRCVRSVVAERLVTRRVDVKSGCEVRQCVQQTAHADQHHSYAGTLEILFSYCSHLLPPIRLPSQHLKPFQSTSFQDQINIINILSVRLSAHYYKDQMSG